MLQDEWIKGVTIDQLVTLVDEPRDLKASPEKTAMMDKNSSEIKAIFKDVSCLDDLGGLSAKDVEASRKQFHDNAIPLEEPESYLSLLWGACQDPTVIMLAIAALISIGMAAAFERTLVSFIEPGIFLKISIKHFYKLKKCLLCYYKTANLSMFFLFFMNL